MAPRSRRNNPGRKSSKASAQGPELRPESLEPEAPQPEEAAPPPAEAPSADVASHGPVEEAQKRLAEALLKAEAAAVGVQAVLHLVVSSRDYVDSGGDHEACSFYAKALLPPNLVLDSEVFHTTDAWLKELVAQALGELNEDLEEQTKDLPVELARCIRRVASASASEE